MSENELDAACKALWECEPHRMLAIGGYATDYESQPETIKLDLRKQVRAVFSACAPQQPQQERRILVEKDDGIEYETMSPIAQPAAVPSGWDIRDIGHNGNIIVVDPDDFCVTVGRSISNSPAEKILLRLSIALISPNSETTK